MHPSSVGWRTGHLLANYGLLTMSYGKWSKVYFRCPRITEIMMQKYNDIYSKSVSGAPVFCSAAPPFLNDHRHYTGKEMAKPGKLKVGRFIQIRRAEIHQTGPLWTSCFSLVYYFMPFMLSRNTVIS